MSMLEITPEEQTALIERFPVLGQIKFWCQDEVWATIRLMNGEEYDFTGTVVFVRPYSKFNQYGVRAHNTQRLWELEESVITLKRRFSPRYLADQFDDRENEEISPTVSQRTYF